ncbi:MAG: GNAT family N-acetyltransferase [Betaproteobacteria bacterium]|nr:GNAT family N-acetyltransferase [Betaproteobacteria bacterium]
MGGPILKPVLLDLPDSLLGSDVILRPYRAGDGAEFFRTLDRDRADILQWVPWGGRYNTADEAEDYVRRMHAKWVTREALILGIWHRDGTYLGGTGFHGFDWAVPSLEFGYWAGTHARGRGWMTQAIRLLLQFGADVLGAERQWATVDTRNTASIALLERCGCVREAHLRHDCRDPQGQLRDTYLYALTRA